MKKVFILRGISGSGKSTWIKNKIKDINEKYPGIGSSVVSADHYFESGCGNTAYHSTTNSVGPMGQVWEAPCTPHCSVYPRLYQFDAKMLGAAHKQCQDNFLHYLRGDNPRFIFVDNTNLSFREIHFYAQTCINYGVEFVIVNVRHDPNRAASRNVHGVSDAKVRQMAQKNV